MALDKEALEVVRKWFTTIVVVLGIPIGTLVLKANNLQLKEEIQEKYVLRTVYQADITELKGIARDTQSKVEALSESVAVIKAQLAKP